MMYTMDVEIVKKIMYSFDVEIVEEFINTHLLSKIRNGDYKLKSFPFLDNGINKKEEYRVSYITFMVDDKHGWQLQYRYDIKSLIAISWLRSNSPLGKNYYFTDEQEKRIINEIDHLFIMEKLSEKKIQF